MRNFFNVLVLVESESVNSMLSVCGTNLGSCPVCFDLFSSEKQMLQWCIPVHYEKVTQLKY